MFGRHVCTSINSMRTHACAHVQMLAQINTQPRSLDMMRESLGGSRLFPCLLVDICSVSSLNRLPAPGGPERNTSNTVANI